MAREKVPSVRWIGGSADAMGRFWVATFANEGAERLAAYIADLRIYWKDTKDAAERASIARTGAHAVKVYQRHFGVL